MLEGFIRLLFLEGFLRRGLPSQVKGAGLRTLSRRGSWVQIPPPAPTTNPESAVLEFSFLDEEGRIQRSDSKEILQDYSNLD